MVGNGFFVCRGKYFVRQILADDKTLHKRNGIAEQIAVPAVIISQLGRLFRIFLQSCLGIGDGNAAAGQLHRNRCIVQIVPALVLQALRCLTEGKSAQRAAAQLDPGINGLHFSGCHSRNGEEHHQCQNQNSHDDSHRAAALPALSMYRAMVHCVKGRGFLACPTAFFILFHCFSYPLSFMPNNSRRNVSSSLSGSDCR